MAAPAAPAFVKGPKCKTHRAAVGWLCSACEQRLCPDCVAEKVMYPTTVTACLLCGGLAEPIVRHRRDAATLTSRLLKAPLFPFRGEGLIAWLALGTLPALLSYLQLEAFAWFVMASALFGVVRSTGRGADQVELSNFVDPISDFLVPNLRFALVTAPVWVGLGFAFALNNRPLLWAALVFGALWVPSALLLASANSSLLSLLDPRAIFTITRRVGNDFVPYVLALLGLSVLLVPAALLAAAIYALPVPFLSRLFAYLVFLYPPFLAAHVAGLVLYLHGDALSFGRPQDYSEPVLGAATPRGVLTEAPVNGPPRVDFTPIDVAHHAPAVASEAPKEPTRARPESLDLGDLPSAESHAAQVVREAIAANDQSGALEAWRSWARGLVPSLTGVEFSWVGRTAASQGDFAVAEAAFTAAANAQGAPAEIGSARVMLARLLEEKLARPVDARAWMQRVTAEQPGTEAARYATDWLAKRAS